LKGISVQRPLANTIATRSLRHERCKVTIALGKPKKAGQRDWVCPFQIEGIGDSTLHAAYGVDAFQALLQAIEGIRLAIVQSGERFTWAGGEEGDPGLPRFVPTYFGLRFTESINGLIDKEVENFAREAEAKYNE
jgi:hypothetical protein